LQEHDRPGERGGAHALPVVGHPRGAGVHPGARVRANPCRDHHAQRSDDQADFGRWEAYLPRIVSSAARSLVRVGGGTARGDRLFRGATLAAALSIPILLAAIIVLLLI